jgi:elongation factor G
VLEAVAEYDESLMEKFFEDPDSISADEMRAAFVLRYRYEHRAHDSVVLPLKTKVYRPLLDGLCIHAFSIGRRSNKGTNPDTEEEKSVSQV